MVTFEHVQVFNIDGAMRGMRFPKKGVATSTSEAISEKDLELAMRLRHASEVDNLAHSKYLRQILVSVDITGPLYWWTEMDTYKVGTTANSESTMHRFIKDIDKLCLEDFSAEDPFVQKTLINTIIPLMTSIAKDENMSNKERIQVLKSILPSGYNQKRHWTANYEVLRNIYKQRKNHRLSEWNTDYRTWVETLPYGSIFIVGEK